MRSVISDLYPEPVPGGSAAAGSEERQIQATSSLPSTSALRRRSSGVRPAASAAGRPSLGSRSLSFIRSGVSAVSSLFTGPRRPAGVQRTRSAPTPNKGKRRAAQPARPRPKSSTGANSPRRTASTASGGDSPMRPASREMFTDTGQDTGQMVDGRTGQAEEQPADQPVQQQTDETPEQQAGQTTEQPEQREGQAAAEGVDQSQEQVPDDPTDHTAELTPDMTPERTTDQSPDQTPGQTPAKPADQTADEVSDQTFSRGPDWSSKEWSTTPLSTSRGQTLPATEDLDSEGRSVASETTSHTDTTIDADEERDSLDSEPFSSSVDDDEGSQRGAASTVASDVDNASVSSPRSSRRVTFDENAPETLMFTPEPGGTGGRSSDEDGSVVTASTDSDSEESPGDSFKRLLEMLRERSLTPVAQYSDEGETSGQQAIDPTGHVARYLREQAERGPADDDDESDIQEDETHTYREGRRPAFPSEPTPGERRSSFGEAIDEFLNYLQAIAEDHKAHQEAMALLDEEPLPADGSEVASEAGDGVWSETGSEMAESASEASSVRTEVDSGLATSSPPLERGEAAGRGTDEGMVSVPVSGSSGAEADTEVQRGIVSEELSHTDGTGQLERQTAEADEVGKPEGSDSVRIDKQEDDSTIHSSGLNSTINNDTAADHDESTPQTEPVVSSPISEQPDDRAAIETSELSHSSGRPTEVNGSQNQSAPSETDGVGSEEGRGTSPAPTDTASAADANLSSVEPRAADPLSPAAGPSPTRSQDSSRESSASDSRRGSAILRGLLRASLPAVEVLGSHSDTDTLQERRASLVTAGGLLPPAADLQARSPGQAGSLETMAKSPGELSKQPSRADSGEASEAVSESELPHHQPVRSLASIADQLLRGDSEEETPRVVPSGIGPANSMAAISSQLLTDHSPGEPADSAQLADMDEADDETELHSIIMHGGMTGHIVAGKAETGEKATGAVKTAEAEIAQKETGTAENAEAEIAEADSVEAEAKVTEAKEAETGDIDARETENGKTDARNTSSPTTKTAEEDAGTAEAMATETVEAKVGAAEAGTPQTGRENTERLNTNEVNDELRTDAREVEDEVREEKLKVVDENHRRGEHDETGAKIGSRAARPIETEEVISGAAENERKGTADLLQKAEEEPTVTDAGGTTEVDNSGDETNTEIEGVRTGRTEAAETQEVSSQNIKAVVRNEEIATRVSDGDKTIEAENTESEETLGQAVSKVDTERTALETAKVEISGNVEERTETTEALESETQPNEDNFEPNLDSNINKTPEVFNTAGSDDLRSDQEYGATANAISDGTSACKNEENETRAKEQTPKQLQPGTSMTDGAPNIAIQTSTRLTLDIDGLGSVISDISKLASYDSYPDYDETGSDDDSEHTDDDEAREATSGKNVSPVDDKKAHLEALALLDSEGTDESSLQNTARTYGREDDVLAGTRKRGEPSEGIVDETVDPDSALSTGSADGPKVSDSHSSIFSDLRSEVSEYTTGSEMEQDTSIKDRIHLTRDGESAATFDDDEIFESETITRLGMLSTTSAKRLVWSLIAMASGIVQHVQESEMNITASKKASSQRDEEKKDSKVQSEDATKYDSESLDNTDRAKKEEEKMSNTMRELKGIHRAQVKDIIKVARVQVEETMKYDAKKISEAGRVPEEKSQSDKRIPDNISDHVTKGAERTVVPMQQLKETHRQQVKEIIIAAENQIRGAISYDNKENGDSYTTDKVIQDENSKPNNISDQVTKEAERADDAIERLKEIHRPQMREIVETAGVFLDETMENGTKDLDNSNKKVKEVSQSDKTMSEVIYDQIKAEAERTNISIEQLREIHGPQVKEIIKAAEDDVIAAVQKAISIITQILSREITKAPRHEFIGGEEVNYSFEPEIKTPSKQSLLASNNEILDVDQNSLVDLGEDDFKVGFGNKDIEVGLENGGIQNESSYASTADIGKRASEIKTGEKPFLTDNVTYELIPKRSFETANPEKSIVGRSTEDLTELEQPSPKDIASIAVAITHSVLGEASDILGDERTAARRLRLRKSTTYDRQAATPSGQQGEQSMDEGPELTSGTEQEDAPVDSGNLDSPSEQAVADESGADATSDTPQADAQATEVDAIDHESAGPATGDALSPDDAPVGSQAGTEAAGVRSAESVEPEPTAGDEPPLFESESESEESDTMIDEGQDTMDSNRIRYEMGEIADQTQNVASAAGITVEMLNAEPEEGAVMVGTDVAGEEPADETLDVREVEEAKVDDDEAAAAEERGGAEDQPDAGVEFQPVAGDDADAGEEGLVSDSRPDAERQDAEVEKVEARTDDRLGVRDDVVTVSVMRVDEPEDPLDPDLVNLPTHGSDTLLPTASLKKQSSWLPEDIVAPDLLAMKVSGSTVEQREAYAEEMAKEIDLASAEDGKKGGDEVAGDILAQYMDDLESSEETETTGPETSSGSQETLKDEDSAGDNDNVFDWLRRVSTEMDKTGITDQLKEMYGEDIVKPIVMAPAAEEEMQEQEPDIPEELPEMVSPKTTHSDTGMYHESSLSFDTTYRIRQSSTQTEVKDDGRADGRKGRSGVARQKPCGSCPCCLSMKRVVGGEPAAGTDGVRQRSSPPKLRQQQQKQQQRPWTSPARSVGDLLDDTSLTTVSSTCTASSVDGDDPYEQRMKHPKRWLKQATDEFMKRECIRQVVLKNDLVSNGRVQTKVTRISRHPNSLTDCLAATRSRTVPGQSLQMEISRGETVVGGRTVNYQDVKIRTPKSCSGLSVRSAPRTRSSRPPPQDQDVSKRFIDTYLAQSEAGSHPDRFGRNGRESKTRKKITIKTDYRN